MIYGILAIHTRMNVNGAMVNIAEFEGHKRDGIVGFMPLFNSRKKAEKWCNNRARLIMLEVDHDIAAQEQTEREGYRTRGRRIVGVAAVRSNVGGGSRGSDRGVERGVQKRTKVRSNKVVQTSGKECGKSEEKRCKAPCSVHSSCRNSTRSK